MGLEVDYYLYKERRSEGDDKIPVRGNHGGQQIKVRST